MMLSDLIAILIYLLIYNVLQSMIKISLLGEQRGGDKEPYLKWGTGRSQGSLKRLEDIYPTKRE